jgi:NADH:ubiquinone oxidoreductase subunit 5 (subunit L)/multisubunit Na+/H+ antiporter MnhA subunit
MFRLVILTFLGDHKDTVRLSQIHESPRVMTVPLIILALFSVFAAFSLNPFSADASWVVRAVLRPETSTPLSVAPPATGVFTEAAHHAHGTAMALSIFVASLGTLLAFVVYFWRKISADAVAGSLPGLHRFLLNKWYFDEVYDSMVVGGTLVFTRILRWVDDKIVDGVVNGVAAWTRALVLGYREHSREGGLSAKAYLGAGAAVSLVVTVLAGEMLWPDVAGFSGLLGAIAGALALGGLTLFLFWAGAGGFDNRVIDGAVNAAAYLSGFGGLLLRKFQSGKVQTYVAFAVMGVMAIYFLFRLI